MENHLERTCSQLSGYCEAGQLSTILLIGLVPRNAKPISNSSVINAITELINKIPYGFTTENAVSNMEEQRAI